MAIIKKVLSNVVQSLSEDDKARARSNIGAAAAADVQDVFIDSPSDLDLTSVLHYDEGIAGQEKYIRCMEILAHGALPVCTARNLGPEGTHGAFGPLSYITDNCELCFSFPTYDSLTNPMVLRLKQSGEWDKVT